MWQEEAFLAQPSRYNKSQDSLQGKSVIRSIWKTELSPCHWEATS